MCTNPLQDYQEISQLFEWASADHYKLWITGSVKRHKKTEAALPRLVKRKKLVAVRWGHKLVYSAHRKRADFYHLAHDLACTEALVRCYRADPRSRPVSGWHLRGLGFRAEWGIFFSNGVLLLFEFASKDNFRRKGLIKRKLAKYQSLERDFIALFVMEAGRDKVAEFVQAVGPTDGRFYFCDWETFLQVPLGEQLRASIYLWGKDGKSYPLVEGDG